MPFYARLDSRQAADRRAAANLVAIKKALTASGLPAKRVDGSLLLATWNVREFGAKKMGPRLEESLFYLAEIISRFDLVAVQEVRDSLGEFNALLDILGAWWKALFTDVTEGAGGNNERTAFLYDSRTLSFGGLAGEIVLPPDPQGLPVLQLARTPYICGFRAGWFRFTICTTHLYYGESQADDPQRLKEMVALANFLRDRVNEKTAWARNMILLGDFNIFTRQDQEYKELVEKAGFEVPKTMLDRQLMTNVGQNKPFDQIAFIAPDLKESLQESSSNVFPFFDHVFRDEDEPTYAKNMGENYEKDSQGLARDAQSKTGYYRKWRTFQMSDHYPLWVELKTDFSDAYLAKKAQAPAG